MAIASTPIAGRAIAGNPPQQITPPSVCDCSRPNTARACFFIIVETGPRPAPVQIVQESVIGEPIAGGVI